VLYGCSTETRDPLGLLSTADDLSGIWEGTAPDGAFYQNDSPNPNCIYEADMRLFLRQEGEELSGSMELTVRSALGPLTDPSALCEEVGSRSVHSLTGTATASGVSFALEDETAAFEGTCGGDFISGEFSSDTPESLKGIWRVGR
jgi:hypothetical protein